ncbi:metal ABC transporter solute-binding protein, Zn/Mn family [Halomonas urumqiensis]|uniref:Metal ABC transporter substrate-binding protein n=1 Tax=Halomonas urumqiensis TaxID=1684789 RepID=A0A2N7UKE3_9GAMM|nr:zinc ABC transporter substrate-binding protein [Halomonas urumqiensis]PMR80901.1 metal ABC transporter substrate-binding protein [Halomonas urumqiensis]PTB02858.1 metal ABC transporter substrate-binding protein [Halomonas urumqiensis]GHE21376.1 ABC transporter substrate-binding protein [Halomonas urumqiensis]
MQPITRAPSSAALLLAVATLLPMPAAIAAERVQVVTSFSILADMIDNVGGEHVEITSLVGPDSDAHVYSPRPTDARRLAEADLVVFNGLRFEGWMERLVESSDYDGALVITTEGIASVPRDEHGHVDHDDHGHDDHADHDDHANDHDDHGGHDDHDHGDQDPHGWQDLAMGQVYVANIRDGLIEADPDNAAAYRDNAERYINELEATDAEIRELLGEIPGSTSVITGHDSFGHFSAAYGIRFLSPVGLSTEAEPSAANMARLIDVIRDENVQALFHENMTSPAIINQLAEETGLEVVGTLYADALAAEGQASTYIGMMLHNARTLHAALADLDHDDHGDHGHDHDHDDH